MEYLSLYDFLGKPAGSDLGKEVAQTAYDAKVITQSRDIKNPKYEGVIKLYPKDFLDFYFREPELKEFLDGDEFEFEPNLGDRQDDDLPF